MSAKNAKNARKPSLFRFFFFRVFCGGREAAGGQYSSYLCLSAFICGLKFLYTCICLRPCSFVAWMQRSEIRGSIAALKNPDYASLHPGYTSGNGHGLNFIASGSPHLNNNVFAFISVYLRTHKTPARLCGTIRSGYYIYSFCNDIWLSMITAWVLFVVPSLRKIGVICALMVASVTPSS